jgi:hypothetical protein
MELKQLVDRRVKQALDALDIRFGRVEHHVERWNVEMDNRVQENITSMMQPIHEMNRLQQKRVSTAFSVLAGQMQEELNKVEKGRNQDTKKDLETVGVHFGAALQGLEVKMQHLTLKQDVAVQQALQALVQTTTAASSSPFVPVTPPGGAPAATQAPITPATPEQRQHQPCSRRRSPGSIGPSLSVGVPPSQPHPQPSYT